MLDNIGEAHANAARDTSMKTDNEKLPPVELAAALGVSVVTVYRWKKQGCPCVEEKPNRAGVTGSRPRYNLQAVRAWLKQRNETGKGVQA